ncbi:reverse transcriptase domain-containing protein [Tanacetum coccineum]
MPITCHMFVYKLKDDARVWWNSLPKGMVTSYEDLKRRFRTHFKQQKKQTKTHLAINGIKKKKGETVRAFISRYTDETTHITRLNDDQRIAGFVHGVKKSLVKFISTKLLKSYDGLMEKTHSWLQAEETASERRPITFMDSSTGDKTQKGKPWKAPEKKNRDKRDRFSPYQEHNLGIFLSLTKSPMEILATEKVVKTFTKPPKMLSKARDTSKYYEFHQDYGHDTNACRELKNQTEEAVKSGKLSHLIKGIKKGRAKQTDT